MPELIFVYDTQLQAAGGRIYAIHAWGEPREHIWHGWLEFTPLDGGATIRSDRETTQPNREALAYWASGLEPVYFEGAFERASRQ